MNTAQEIVDQLNRIESQSDEPGQNSADVWEYIQRLDEWDVDATQAIDPNERSDRFALRSGEIIRWDDQRKAWYEQG